MRLIISNHTCVLSVSKLGEVEHLRALDEEFSMPSPNYWFNRKFRSGIWDGKIHFVRVRGTIARFETGLLPEVLEQLEKAGVNLVQEDKRRLPDIPKMLLRVSPNMLSNLTLREDYQVPAVSSCVKSLRGVLGMATNAGKTAISAGIIQAAQLKSLQLTPSKDVMYQTKKDFEEYLQQEIGQIGDGIFSPEMVTVGMPQTLSKKKYKPFLEGIELAIVDECHHMKAKTWLDVLKACKNAVMRIGLSGTPHASEIAERKLTGATGQIIFTVSNEYLIKKGYSAEPHFLYLRILQPEIEYLCYEEAYKQGIVRSQVRNQRIVEVCAAIPNKQKLILVWEMEHGKRLLKLLRGQRIKVEFLHGGESSDNRNRVKAEFKAGKLRTLIASTIFDEGVDIPNIEVLVLAAGWKTSLRFLQRVGRAMRKKKGRNFVIVVDFLDLSNYYLLEHSYNRYLTAKGEGFKIEVEEGE